MQALRERRGERMRAYVAANVGLFLPALVILPSTLALLAAVPADTLERAFAFTAAFYTSCDFRGGGGSLNLCSDDVIGSALLAALALSTAAAFVAAKKLGARLAPGVRSVWLSPAFGIALFYLLALLVAVDHAVVGQGMYGGARRALHLLLLEVETPTALALVYALSLFNLRVYRQWRERKKSGPTR